MLSKDIVAVNKIILILYLKERCTEGVKILIVSLYLHLEKGNTLCLSHIYTARFFFPQIVIYSHEIKGKIWEPSSGENNVSGFHNVAILL